MRCWVCRGTPLLLRQTVCATRLAVRSAVPRAVSCCSCTLTASRLARVLSTLRRLRPRFAPTTSVPASCWTLRGARMLRGAVVRRRRGRPHVSTTPCRRTRALVGGVRRRRSRRVPQLVPGSALPVLQARLPARVLLHGPAGALLLLRALRALRALRMLRAPRALRALRVLQALRALRAVRAPPPRTPRARSAPPLGSTPAAYPPRPGGGAACLPGAAAAGGGAAGVRGSRAGGVAGSGGCSCCAPGAGARCAC